MKHQPAGLLERLNQQARRNIGDNDDRDQPAEYEPEKPRINYVRITRDVEKVEIPVDQPLRADDPKTHRGKAEHDRIAHGDAKDERTQIKQDRQRIWHDPELGQRDADHHATERGVNDAVETELLRGNGE